MIGMILRPIEGDEESVRALANTLTSGAAKLSAINGVLVNIKAGASWDSPAGEVFEQAVQESPPLLDALIDRYAGAATALRSFATELGESQAMAQRAIEQHKAEYAAYTAMDDEMASRMSAGLPWDDVLVRQNAVLANLNSAQARHGTAWAQFEAADRRLAGQLRELADDILDDSWHYTALTTVLSVSRVAASVPPLGRLVPGLGQVTAAGGAVTAVGEFALLAFYGEGSWKQLAVNTVANVAGVGAKAVSAGGLARSTTFTRLADGKRGHLGESLSTKDRFFIGTRDQLHKAYPKLGKAIDPKTGPSRMIVPVDAVPPMVATKGMALKDKARVWRAHGDAVVRRQADAAFFDNWKAATAGGANAQKMFVAGSTLEKVIPKVESRVTDALGDKPAEKATRPTYP